MSEEEMKAVDYWKNYMEILHWNTQLASEHYMKVLLDLIEKQQIELNSLKEIEYKYNKALEDLVKLEKERQADKEKIKEYAELLIKVNVQNLNNSIEQRKESNEQLEALHEGWKIELEKKDNRIKELYEIIINNKPHIAQQKLKLYIEELLKDGGE